MFASQPNPGSRGGNAPGENPPLSDREDGGEYYLELITDTLQQLEPAVQGAFLQRFLKSVTSVDVSEQESVFHWQEVLRRRNELTERLGRPVNLKTAAVDYFGTALLLRNPILMEYRELKRLLHNAATDALTGLYNRRLFDEYLLKELNRSRRYAYPLALLLFDLRNFKQVNDTYGHPVGDEVLRSLARASLETIRGSDYACRIGGDEFALLLPQSEARSAHSLAERITQKFDEYARSLAPDLPLGLDYGVAAFPDDGDNTATLFEVADRNLYAHRKNTQRRVVEPQLEAEPPREGVEGSPPPTLNTTADTRQKRRYERVSLAGSNAYGVLCNGFGPKLARVLDLSFGGVAFLLDEAVTLPDTFHARLHVPILPAAEFRVRRIYTHRLAQGMLRVGCCFAA